MSKLFKTMVTTLVILTILGVVVFLVIKFNVTGETEGKENNIDDMVENSYETSEITTDLQDGNFVRIQFQIITDSKKAKEEVEKREFQVKNILIKELATMNEEDFKSGLSNLEETITQRLNEEMQDGTITSVYTISKVLQ